MSPLPLLVLLAACSSVEVSGGDEFGMVASAWHYDGSTLGRMVVLGDGGAYDLGEATIDAALRMATFAGGCAAEQAYVDGWGDNSEDLVDAYDSDSGEVCSAVADFLEAQDELVASLYPDEYAMLSVFACGEEGDCELEADEYDLGEVDGGGGYAYGTLRHVELEEHADRWDTDACAFTEEADTDRMAIFDGALTIESDDGGTLVGELDASLADYDDWLADGDDAEADGSVYARFSAAECSLDFPDALVVY